jgi:hypothetical protein
MRLIRLTVSGFLALALFAVSLAACQRSPDTKPPVPGAMAMGFGPTEEIPGQYTTWSLFLVCNPKWLMPARSEDLGNLYRQFKRFGDAIGKDNLAVWFWNRRTTLYESNLAEYVDVARSAELCRVLKLRPTEGPFLVITSTYPSPVSFPGERAVFALGGREPKDLENLLGGLTDDLLLTGKVDPGNYPVLSARLWERLLDAARRNLIAFGCGVAPKIKVSVLSVELTGCPRGGQ